MSVHPSLCCPRACSAVLPASPRAVPAKLCAAAQTQHHQTWHHGHSSWRQLACLLRPCPEKRHALRYGELFREPRAAAGMRAPKGPCRAGTDGEITSVSLFSPPCPGGAPCPVAHQGLLSTGTPSSFDPWSGPGGRCGLRGVGLLSPTLPEGTEHHGDAQAGALAVIVERLNFRTFVIFVSPKLGFF